MLLNLVLGYIPTDTNTDKFTVTNKTIWQIIAIRRLSRLALTRLKRYGRGEGADNATDAKSTKKNKIMTCITKLSTELAES